MAAGGPFPWLAGSFWSRSVIRSVKLAGFGRERDQFPFGTTRSAIKAREKGPFSGHLAFLGDV